MKAQLITLKNKKPRVSETLNCRQITNPYKELAKTTRDFLLVTASLIFFSCTMYYAIVSGKKVSAQATEYKIQNYKSQKQTL